MKVKKNSLNGVIISLLIILAPITRIRIILYQMITEIDNRVYSNEISLTFSIIIIAFFAVLNLRTLVRRKVSAPKGLVFFLLYSILTIVYGTYTNADAVKCGLFQIVFYLLLLIVCERLNNPDNLMASIENGLTIGVLFQSSIGILNYLGISIPYITAERTTTIRNGLMRMQGTFSHPSELSLYILIGLVLFLSRFYIEENRRHLILLILAYVDILLCGSRSAMMISVVMLISVLWIKYRKKILGKFLILVVIVSMVVFIPMTEEFQYFFLELDFNEMFQARFLHWIIGWRIMTSSLKNFLFGVGLNNNVDYISTHYLSLSEGLSANSKLTADFAINNPIHNAFFVVGAETGIIGFVSFICVFLKGIIKSYKRYKAYSTYRTENIFVTLSFCAFLFYHIQGWGGLKQSAWMLFILLEALNCGLEKKNAKTGVCLRR